MGWNRIIYSQDLIGNGQRNTAVHQNREVANRLKAIGQAKFEENYGTREDFVRIFGRNYI